MFNVGGGEILVILLIALIVLGPDRLPGAARTAGRVMGELRRLSQSFQDEVRQAVDLSELDINFTGNPGPSLPPLPESNANLGEAATSTDPQRGPSTPSGARFDPSGQSATAGPPSGAGESDVATDHGGSGAGGKLSA
ncbi:MAG: Sec-independent protein translocase protein TatB [Acidimicrobiales bacterium]|nr:Sec-independent protein translocase protein TatB [Acidimicrobiales bacterium]